MPSLPQRGEVTICEINCDLMTAENLSDERAAETYGGVLGFVFSPFPFRTDAVLPSEQAVELERNDTTPRSVFVAFKEILSDSFKRILYPSAQLCEEFTGNSKAQYTVAGGRSSSLIQHLNLSAEVSSERVNWHPHKHIVACISGSNQVLIRDYDNSERKDPCILTSDAQSEIKSLEWRPNSGKTLCVACKGGICIWSESYPGNVPSVRSGVASSVGTVSCGSGIRWILVDFLRSPTSEHISAISCSPDGRYLASASHGSSSFTIWDIAQGAGTPVRRGLGAISILKWSPTGDYLLTTMSDGTFYLWETNTWTSEPWSSTGGYITGVAWDPIGRMALLAFSESNTLGSLHFASRPPALDAHLLPVELPEIASLTGSCGIEKIAWDASGERLALSFRDGEEMYRGLIALYDIKRTPLISPSLVGFIRGPGEYSKPLAFSFHSKFKQGPLLSVCWSSGLCCTYPLIFRSHILP